MNFLQKPRSFQPSLATTVLPLITSSIPAVTPQQTTPSPRYYRKFHRQNCGIPTVTAVLQPSPLPCSSLHDMAVCTMHYTRTSLAHRPTAPKYRSWKLPWHLVHTHKHRNRDRPPAFSPKHQETDLEKSHTVTTLQRTLCLLVIFAYKTFQIQDTSPAGHFAYCTVCLLLVHFAYMAVHQS